MGDNVTPGPRGKSHFFFEDSELGVFLKRVLLSPQYTRFADQRKSYNGMPV